MTLLCYVIHRHSGVISLEIWFLSVEYFYCMCDSKYSKGNLCFRGFLPGSWVPSGSHSVCLPHAHKCHYSQQFPPSISYLTSDTWKYHLCSCLCCARHHLHLCPLPSSKPAQHLLLCAAVMEWILWLQQIHQQDSNQKLTLACPDSVWWLCPGLIMFNWDYWDCITIGMNQQVWYFPLQLDTTKKLSCELASESCHPDT